MKTRNPLQILLDGKPMHYKNGMATPEGVEFLEAVREHELNRRLDKVTLETLGDIHCVHSAAQEFPNYHSVESDNPRSTKIAELGETQCLTCFADFGHCTRVGKKRTQKVLGLTRDGKWIVVSVHIILKWVRGTRTVRERAFFVDIEEMPLEKALRETYIKFFGVWQMFNMEVDDWERAALQRHKPFLETKQSLKALDTVLTAMLMRNLPKGEDNMISIARAVL